MTERQGEWQINAVDRIISVIRELQITCGYITRVGTGHRDIGVTFTRAVSKGKGSGFI